MDAGNWRVSASWNVPATAVSGVYIAKLTREDGTFGESHIIFVVRDDESHSDLLMQTSDTNWVAYSDYGGSSLYGNNFLPLGRAYEVSYNRPLTTRDRANTTFFFGAEYPMVRFLEPTGTTSAIPPASTPIAAARSCSSTRYSCPWGTTNTGRTSSAQCRGGARRGSEPGVLQRQRNVLEDTLGRQHSRPDDSLHTLVSYKETHDNAKTDPLDDVWTGTWRDPRFHRPTAAVPRMRSPVLFSRSTATALSAARSRSAPPTGRCDSGETRASPISLETNRRRVGDYVLGYEWDEDIDNGFRPDGLIHLSTTTANVSAYLQDYGSTYAAGTATHHLTLYRAASGALVFGAGTIQYSWGLDSFHDGQASNTDVALQQATVNLFADMGVQPTTLMQGPGGGRDVDRLRSARHDHYVADRGHDYFGWHLVHDPRNRAGLGRRARRCGRSLGRRRHDLASRRWPRELDLHLDSPLQWTGEYSHAGQRR